MSDTVFEHGRIVISKGILEHHGFGIVRSRDAETGEVVIRVMLVKKGDRGTIVLPENYTEPDETTVQVPIEYANVEDYQKDLIRRDAVCGPECNICNDFEYEETAGSHIHKWRPSDKPEYKKHCVLCGQYSD